MTAAVNLDARTRELVTLGTFERIRQHVMNAAHADVVAYVLINGETTTLTFFDRRKLSTDPQLPPALRFIRNAGAGTWVVAVRERDGANVRFRARFLRMVRGGTS